MRQEEQEDIGIDVMESGQPIKLEAGVYPAVIERLERIPPREYKEQVKFYLKTEEIGDDGEPVVLWAWATTKLTPSTKLYGWMTAIIGSPPELGSRSTINKLLIGKPCRVQVSEVIKDGEPRKKVTDILAPLKAAPAAAPTADTCSQCSEDVFSFDAKGVPFCASHAPKVAV